jgi:hypothetical protein
MGGLHVLAVLVDPLGDDRDLGARVGIGIGKWEGIEATPRPTSHGCAKRERQGNIRRLKRSR